MSLHTPKVIINSQKIVINELDNNLLNSTLSTQLSLILIFNDYTPKIINTQKIIID